MGCNCIPSFVKAKQIIKISVNGTKIFLITYIV